MPPLTMKEVSVKEAQQNTILSMHSQAMAWRETQMPESAALSKEQWITYLQVKRMFLKVIMMYSYLKRI